MIDAGAISEIVATYKKHGWILRRVLLSAALKRQLGEEAKRLFNDVAVVDSSVDAAWFSRPPKSGGVSWEIRYLGDLPFALLENLDENDPAFEASLQSVEKLLREKVAAKQTA